MLPKENGKSVIGDPTTCCSYGMKTKREGMRAVRCNSSLGTLSCQIIRNRTDYAAAGRLDGADTEKTITAEVKFADTAIQKKVEISQNADGSGEKYALSENPDGTYSTAEVKTGGIWYVTATDETSGLTAMKPVGIKIDTPPPDITICRAWEITEYRLWQRMRRAVWAACIGLQMQMAPKQRRVALQDGAYTSGEITELGTYYVYAVDAVGNASEALPVEVTQLFDTTPPDISNITYEQQADGSWKVAFTVEDTPRLPEPATAWIRRPCSGKKEWKAHMCRQCRILPSRTAATIISRPMEVSRMRSIISMRKTMQETR